jgi:hypothetical protein
MDRVRELLVSAPAIHADVTVRLWPGLARQEPQYAHAPSWSSGRKIGVLGQVAPQQRSAAGVAATGPRTRGQATFAPGSRHSTENQ